MLPNGASRRYVRSGSSCIARRSGSPIAPSVDGKPLRLIVERLAADLELLEPVLVEHDAQRPVAVLRLEVRLPQVGRLEDVAVGVDGAGERQPLGDVHRLRHRHLRSA